MAKGQKEAVVELVCAVLGSSFVPGKANALNLLTSSQLSAIKDAVCRDILSGAITYGKPLNSREVKAYASSMVMNHLKKAKELNGGISVSSSSGKQPAATTKASSSAGSLTAGMDLSIMPQYAIDVIKTQNEDAIF
jgi:hypothetical protein